MSAGRFCDECQADLWTTDPNERISLVPQVIQGLWPILRDTQEQLDFCGPAHAVAWFEHAAKQRPRLLKDEAKRDAEVTGKALADAARSAEILARLNEIPDEHARLAATPGSEHHARAVERERHELVRELNEIGGGRRLATSSPPAGTGATAAGGSRGGGKTRTRR